MSSLPRAGRRNHWHIRDHRATRATQARQWVRQFAAFADEDDEEGLPDEMPDDLRADLDDEQQAALALVIRVAYDAGKKAG
jgi:hypothetical protein